MMETKSLSISKISLRQVRIPLNFQFAQSNNPGISQSDSSLISFHGDNGKIGYGEACPRLYVTGEDYDSMVQDLHKISDLLFSERIGNFDHFSKSLESWDIGSSTRCGLEMAWLDLFSKVTGQTIPEILDIQLPTTLRYSLVLPLISETSIQKLCERIKMFSPPSLKLKVDDKIDDHLKKISIIRSYFGEEVPIRLDCNGGWSREDAHSMIPQYIKIGVRSFEQPLDPKDSEGAKQLTSTFGNEAQVMADEGLTSIDDAERILEQSIYNHLNIKISKLGGISRSKTICNMAESFDIPCQMGAHFGETSLLTAAGIALAGSVSGFDQHEGGLGTLLLKEDIVNNPIQQDLEGNIHSKGLFESPGFVNGIDIGLIEKYSTKIEVWTKS